MVSFIHVETVRGSLVSTAHRAGTEKVLSKHSLGKSRKTKEEGCWGQVRLGIVVPRAVWESVLVS